MSIPWFMTVRQTGLSTMYYHNGVTMASNTVIISRDVPDRDFRYVAGTGIYCISDIDTTTVRHWAESTIPSEWHSVVWVQY